MKLNYLSTHVQARLFNEASQRTETHFLSCNFVRLETAADLVSMLQNLDEMKLKDLTGELIEKLSMVEMPKIDKKCKARAVY